VLLIIDEVSVIQNPALAQILSEARKFGLSVILTQQYFGQIEQDLQAAIFTNVYNYYVFKVSEEDARVLEGNLNIEIPKEILKGEKDKGLKQSDVRVQMLTSLHPRECFLRLSAGGQLLPCVKARTLDITTAPVVEQVNLKEYDRSQDMPAKFVESASPPLQEVQTADSYVQQSQNHTAPGVPPAQLPGQREYLNLQDILAAHSSSKENVNNSNKKEH
jgi:hypothetical protein